MLNYKEMILSTTLAVAIIAPTAVYAQPLNAVKPDCKMSVCEKKCAKDNCKMEGEKMTEDPNCNKAEKISAKDKKFQKKQQKVAAKFETYEQTLQKAEKFVPGITSSHGN